MRYRRAKISGGTYFFTLVTHQRQEFLDRSENISLLRSAFRRVNQSHPFVLEAIVILPEHLHLLMTLPVGDDNYPKRIRLIKSYFSRCYANIGVENPASRVRKNERAVWQRRYWEHAIRDDADFNSHVDYIHYNPVKHGCVDAPVAWKHSSFHSYVAKGVLSREWGAGGVVFDADVGME